MNELDFEIYLPKVMKANVQTGIDPTQEIVVSSNDPNLAGIQITVPPDSLFRDSGAEPTFVGIASVPPDRLPGRLPPGVDTSRVITFQSDATNLRFPAAVRFPNTDGLPPGEKLNLLSFNHDVGRFEVAGLMTVDPTGTFIATDPGVGIPAPGWHLPCGCGQGEGGGGGCAPGGAARAADDPTCSGCGPDSDSCKQAKRCYVIKAAGAAGACTIACSSIFACVIVCGPAMAGMHCAAQSTNRKCAPCPGGSRNASRMTGDVFDKATPFIEATADVFSRMRALVFAAFEQGKLTAKDEAQLASLFAELDELGGGDYQGFVADLLDQMFEQQLDIFANTPPSGSIPFVVINETAVIRGRTGADGRYSVFLPLDSDNVMLAFFDPVLWSIGITAIRGVPSPATVAVPDYVLADATLEEDFDIDGLPDLAEAVLGTSLVNADTDGDGILDGAEVRAGTDPLDGGLAINGIVGSIDTPGFAHEVCVRNDLAYVADGPEGLSIFNIFKPTEPALVVRVDTPGTAVDVDCGDELVAVADADAGLAIIDITDPPNARIVHQVALPESAQARSVVTLLDIAFVGDDRSRVHLIELSTGIVTGSLILAPGTSVDDLAISDRTLFALTTANTGTSGQLIAFDITSGLPTELDRISANHSGERTGPFPRRRLFAGTNSALASTFGGFTGYDISDPTNITQTCANIILAAARGVVTNGSGSVVITAGTSGDAEAQVFTGFPASCNTTLAQFDTPGNAHGVAMNNGLVYLADGDFGLHVINILSVDVNGIPPTGTLTTSVQSGVAPEGGRIFVSANVSDDVQVRNVEFFVDGDRLTVDGNFPFGFAWPVPLGTAGGTASFTGVARDTGGNELALGPIDLSIILDTEPPIGAPVSIHWRNASPATANSYQPRQARSHATVPAKHHATGFRDSAKGR